MPIIAFSGFLSFSFSRQFFCFFPIFFFTAFEVKFIPRVLPDSHLFSHHAKLNWSTLISVRRHFYSRPLKHYRVVCYNSLTHWKTVVPLNRLKVSSKPPLGSGLVSLCAAEFVADAVSVPAKVVFTWRCTNFCRLELTVGVGTVDMQCPCI